MSKKNTDPYGILTGLDVSNDALEKLSSFRFDEDNSITEDEYKSSAKPGDICPECLCLLKINNLTYECPACLRVFEPSDMQDVTPVSNPEIPGAASLRGRLRILGPDSRRLQSDMDRTNPGETPEQQKNATYNELLKLNSEFKSRGGNPFPLSVLHSVAESYYKVQQQGVKRSMMKKVIIAALLYYTCIDHNFTRMTSEVAEFAQLHNHGISRGVSYLLSLPDLDININKDSLYPHITTTFSHLEINEEYEFLRDAVADIVKVAAENNIGNSSMIRSQVIAATAEILKRWRPEDDNFKPEKIADKCCIRIHTIRKFIDELRKFHSYFEGVYKKYELIHIPLFKK